MTIKTSVHAEAGLHRKLVLFAVQLEGYLAHFPNCHKYTITQGIRQAFLDVYNLVTEAQKRYHKKTQRWLMYHIGSPRSLIPLYIFQGVTPSFLASCVAVYLTPSCSIQTWLRRLFCCVKWSTHRQFSGEYGPVTSSRSSVSPSGLSFAHEINPSNVRQASQTNTPFAPYDANCLSVGLWHRLIMCRQRLYLSLCAEKTQPLTRSFAARFAVSLRMHPQELVSPFCSKYDAAVFSVPQSHRQSHIARPFVSFSDLFNTVNLLNFLPARSMSFTFPPLSFSFPQSNSNPTN